MNNTLLELMQIGSEKNYEFQLKMIEEKQNSINVDTDNKIIRVEIGIPESEELTEMIVYSIRKVV